MDSVDEAVDRGNRLVPVPATGNAHSRTFPPMPTGTIETRRNDMKYDIEINTYNSSAIKESCRRDRGDPHAADWHRASRNGISAAAGTQREERRGSASPRHKRRAGLGRR